MLLTLKQVIVMRGDLKLSLGKAAAQASHASVSAALKSKKTALKKWQLEGQKKVILKARNLEELIALKKKCDRLGLTNSIISDAGRTELAAGTITALGIGPDDEKKIDKVTGSLPLLK
ncbi:MAG: peptidyl-tRNA hydrolase [Candidatus Aenigmarchaeota archaeon]|nr:peptidyl-tRNA hydrolase [Candidatus Aenigmarchaeota archaeon]